jgi:hypothetical protein
VSFSSPDRPSPIATALNFMQCHNFAKSGNLRDLSLPVSGLYLLAAPSTPDEARAMAVAIIYPEPEKGGIGKGKIASVTKTISGAFSPALLSQARAVVPYPDLSKCRLAFGAGMRSLFATAFLDPLRAKNVKLHLTSCRLLSGLAPPAPWSTMAPATGREAPGRRLPTRTPERVG